MQQDYGSVIDFDEVTRRFIGMGPAYQSARPFPI